MSAKKVFSILLALLLFTLLAGCGVSDQPVQTDTSSSSGSNGGGAGGSGGTGGSVAGTLAWDAPTSNANGSPVTDLAGYKIYYGTVPGNYTASINVGNVTSVPVTTLSSAVPAPGLYYIAVTAYDTVGNESAYSNEIIKSL